MMKNCQKCLQSYSKKTVFKVLKCQDEYCLECLRKEYQLKQSISCQKCYIIQKIHPDNLDNAEDKLNAKLVCESHNLKVSFFCQTCDQCICVQCLQTFSHKQHQTVTLQTKIEEVQQKFKNWMKKIDQQSIFLNESQQSFQQSCNELESLLNKVQEQLKQSIDIYFNAFKCNREQELNCFLKQKNEVINQLTLFGSQIFRESQKLDENLNKEQAIESLLSALLIIDQINKKDFRFKEIQRSNPEERGDLQELIAIQIKNVKNQYQFFLQQISFKFQSLNKSFEN